jgi:hypothetical protein
MIRDIVWILGFALVAAGIGLMHVPTALIFLGLCCGAIAHFGIRERH